MASFVTFSRASIASPRPPAPTRRQPKDNGQRTTYPIITYYVRCLRPCAVFPRRTSGGDRHIRDDRKTGENRKICGFTRNRCAAGQRAHSYSCGLQPACESPPATLLAEPDRSCGKQVSSCVYRDVKRGATAPASPNENRQTMPGPVARSIDERAAVCGAVPWREGFDFPRMSFVLAPSV